MPRQATIFVSILLMFFVGCTRSPAVVDDTEWPLAMADLLAEYPKIAGSIVTCKHDASVDAKVTWKIVGQADEVDRLIDELNLNAATIEHVKYKELQRSIPETWALPDIENSFVYVSDGYGDKHQEGTDLLLLVRDSSTSETLVLYEWIF